jgi:hypothetical protein
MTQEKVMYSSVYGNAAPVPVLPNQVIHTGGSRDYPRIKRSDVDRRIVMTVRKIDATVTVQGYGGMPVQIPAPAVTIQVNAPKPLPTCGVCTLQHRGEC